MLLMDVGVIPDFLPGSRLLSLLRHHCFCLQAFPVKCLFMPELPGRFALIAPCCLLP